MLQIIVGLASFNAGLSADEAAQVWEFMRESTAFATVHDSHVLFAEAVEQVKANPVPTNGN
jgi:hypothetical protein